MNPVLPKHIASSAFCFISSILIAYHSLKHPNKLRLFILGYSIMTLPASIISTIYIEDLVSARTNSIVYLVSTLLMTVTHFFMLLDVGKRLRLGVSYWNHVLVLFGIFFLGCTVIVIFVQIIILGENRTGMEEYPLRPCFITGVICAICGDMAVFTYTFKPLLYWKENRLNEGHSRTTALGIWFFLIQQSWYSLYGVLYIWFFVMNSWSYFSTLLAFDYAMRFVENLMYTWPPPKFAINYLSSKLPNSSMDASVTRNSSNNATHAFSSERYNEEELIEYRDNKELQVITTTHAPSEYSLNSRYGSKVTIVSK